MCHSALGLSPSFGGGYYFTALASLLGSIGFYFLVNGPVIGPG